MTETFEGVAGPEFSVTVAEFDSGIALVANEQFRLARVVLDREAAIRLADHIYEVCKWQAR